MNVVPMTPQQARFRFEDDIFAAGQLVPVMNEENAHSDLGARDDDPGVTPRAPVVAYCVIDELFAWSRMIE